MTILYFFNIQNPVLKPLPLVGEVAEEQALLLAERLRQRSMERGFILSKSSFEAFAV
jgi:hypothetical protein